MSCCHISLRLFLLHLPSSHTFFSLSSSPFFLIQSLVNISLLFILSFPLSNPHSTAVLTLLPSSFLQTTPHSQTITTHFSDCTSESYDFLCSYLFVLLENPRVSFISFVALTLPLCKEKVAPFVCLARRWYCVRNVWKNFKFYLILLVFLEKQNKIKQYQLIIFSSNCQTD